MKASILLADDDPDTRAVLSARLAHAGYSVLTAEHGGDVKRLMVEDISVAVLDLNMPVASGFECLVSFRQHRPDVQVLIFSASEQPKDIAQAMRLGAFWYLTKKSPFEEVVSLIDQAHRHAELFRENRKLRDALTTPLPTTPIIGESAVMLDLAEKAKRAASMRSSILLCGETGVGKSLLAGWLHQWSPNRAGPFVAVNCAAVPRESLNQELFGSSEDSKDVTIQGKIDLARGGTLLLDEVCDFPLDLQPKLLNYFPDAAGISAPGAAPHAGEPRIIVTTHQDIEDRCANGHFRQDLFYRMAVVTLEVPPLRRRTEDIIPIAEYYLQQLTKSNGHQRKLSEGARRTLSNYRWPGNVRELENTIQRAVAFTEGPTIEAGALMISEVPKTPPSTITGLAGIGLEDLERQAIRETLQACKGNKAQAARVLGISERSIYNKLARYGLG